MCLVISTVLLKLVKVTSSCIHCKSGNILEMMQGRDVTTDWKQMVEVI